MKYFIFLVIFSLSLGSADPKVMICRSKTSYAYHNSLCRGLKACTHKVETVTLSEAKQLGKGKPCGWCYRK